MVVSANTFFDGSVELPSPPRTGASISIRASVADAYVAALRAFFSAAQRERLGRHWGMVVKIGRERCQD
jgi:hypothetical protein